MSSVCYIIANENRPFQRPAIISKGVCASRGRCDGIMKLKTPAFKEHFTESEVLALEKEFISTYTQNNSKPLRTLIRLYKRYWKELLVSIIFFVIKTSPVWLIPIVTANIINAVVYPTDNLVQTIVINVSVLASLILLNIPTHMIHTRYYSIVVRRVEAGLRGAMVRKLQHLSISFHREMQSGRIQSKLIRDVEAVSGLSVELFTSIPGAIISMLVYLFVVGFTNIIVFAFFIFCVPCSVTLVRIFRRRLRKTNSEYRVNMESTSASLTEMEEMIEINRAHALENKEIRKETRTLNSMANTGFRLDMTNALFGASNWVTIQLFQLLCLCFTAYLAYQGIIRVGDISLYQSYFASLTAQVSSLIMLMPAIAKGLESVSSIGEILTSTDIEDNEGKLALDNIQGHFQFDNVSFHYVEDQPLLQGVDLDVRAGETLAIVGESGSGKTTMLNLIIGFNHPTAGRVLLDGHDISELDLHAYRKHIAIVPQNSVLFSGTIRENITYGLSDISEETIQDAVDAAQLRDFIRALPLGIDTPLTEHGANLSGGQRQRISIARAIIRNPKVIILDEATSALDSVSEKLIQNAIRNLTKDRTTFIVAHRLSTIRDADRIAVIKQGRCVELGNYDELMEKKGVFYQMQTVR